MSPKLKPLILPQLVEERRKREEQEQQLLQQQQHRLLQQSIQQAIAEGDLSCIYYTHNSSSSDVASPSPVTPTFSRSGHSRYSGSTSSLELMPSSCSESPASPSQLPHSVKPGKRQLPDVQEDPLEREEEDTTLVPEHGGLYDCLCDEPCIHRDADLSYSAINSCTAYDFDYDIGFLSDNDFDSGLRFSRKRRAGSESPFSGWGSRIGTRFNTLTRWKTTSRRTNPTFSPASEPSFDFRPSLSMSRAPSSRSSSLSAPARRLPDRVNEPPLPSTPALSFYGSTESIELPTALDIEKANLRRSIERDRSMATTPLLPPLLTENVISQSASLQASPLQSPAVVPSPNPDASMSQLYLSPAPSNRPSIASFRPIVNTVISPLPASPTEISSPPAMANLLEQHDEWSDRLGHANFTITPKPYRPDDASIEVLRTFRADWDLAKVNYTKHLVRTGEHYGTTSKTYRLTEAKWAEIERQWHVAQADLIERVAKLGSDAAFASLQWHRLQQDMSPGAVPRMLDAEKFPERGDEDIVGPMVRDAFMMRDGYGPGSADERRNGASTFWKNLVEKVGLRR